MTYFKNIKSLEDLKNQFKTLARKNHPDAGGNAEIMKAINCEYDQLFPIWKHRRDMAEPQTQTAETADSTRSEFYTQNGWKGENYNSNQSLKEIAVIIRAYVKELYPTYKFSVRTSYASMCQELHVDLKESPIEIYKAGADLNEDDKNQFRRKAVLNNYFSLDCWNDAELIEEYERVTSAHGNFYKVLNETTRAVIEDVDSFVNSYNYKDCDGMIDYFHVDFYYFGCAENNGTNIKIVPKTAKIKNKTSKLTKANKTTPNAEKPAIEHKNDYTYNITKGEDTRDGSELWVVRIAKNLNREDYLAMNKKMQDLGGYYSKFKHGFIFRFDPAEVLKIDKAA